MMVYWRNTVNDVPYEFRAVYEKHPLVSEDVGSLWCCIQKIKNS